MEIKVILKATVTGIQSLIICFCGGYLFTKINAPLPWMLGSLFAMAAVKMATTSFNSPRGGRQTGQLIIGCVLGQYFTPEVVREIHTYIWIAPVAAIGAFLIGSFGTLVLSRVTGIDKTTAFFSCIPGGASEMVVLGERFGAQTDRIALAHSLRVFLVALLVPSILSFSGASGSDPYHPSQINFQLWGLLLLLFLAGGAGLVFKRFSAPNAWMMGPLFVSTALTITGHSLSAIPQFLIISGQVFIGCALGSSFGPEFLNKAPKFILGVIASTSLAIALSILLGICLAFMGGVNKASMILATAPGGISEMCLTAKMLHLGVPLITSVHVTRLVIIVTLSGPLLKCCRFAVSWLRSNFGEKLANARDNNETEL